MFTGSVLGLGEVTSVQDTNVTISIKRSDNLYQRFEDLKIGDSVAVDGQACKVHMVGENAQNFQFQVGISGLKLHDKVNLERCTLATSKLSGIFMLGILDTTGTISKIATQLQDHHVFNVKVSCEIMKKISVNGVILANGVALTVTQVNDENNEFTFVLYRGTVEGTSLGLKVEGDTVNIELDILSKYVERYHVEPLQAKMKDKTLPVLLKNKINSESGIGC